MSELGSLVAAQTFPRPPGKDTVLIGLGHRKQVGKDTIAAELSHTYGFVPVAFADPLRALALTLDPWFPDGPEALTYSEILDRDGYEGAKRNPLVRQFLIRLGAGVRTHLGPDIWLDAGMDEINALLDNGYPVVVTDVRYPNEAEAIQDRGGVVLRVDRPGVPISTDPADSDNALEGWEWWDGVVTNNWTPAAAADEALRLWFEAFHR